MTKQNWCEHDEKISKYTMLSYDFADKSIVLRIQSWCCPECGMYGAEAEAVNPVSTAKNPAAKFTT